MGIRGRVSRGGFLDELEGDFWMSLDEFGRA